MLLEPRLTSKRLAELCHRLGVQLEAGIDIRRAWQREADAASGQLREQFQGVRDAVAGGDSLTEALRHTGRLFPRLFLEMVRVGEQTGMLAEVLRRLAEHYRQQVQMHRTFLGLVWWPLLQLGIAIIVVGIVIWVLGIVAQRNNGEPIDILGFGLVGGRGLAIYVALVTSAGLGVAGIVVAVQRGTLWTRPLQRAAVQMPAIGPCLQKICLARLTWAMHLTLNVEMDLRRLIPLVLRATGNDFYIRQSDTITGAVAAGHPLYAAFRKAGRFPTDFLDTLEVGEESGQIVEATGRLSRRYQEEAESAMQTLSVLAGFVVWGLVAALIIMMIFRLFSFYLGVLTNAGNI